MKILNKVQEACPVNPLEYSYNPGKMHSFQGPGTALQESNKYTQIVVLINCPRVSDWVDGLIGPSELLLVVSHLFAVPILVEWWGFEECSPKRLNFFIPMVCSHVPTFCSILLYPVLFSHFHGPNVYMVCSPCSQSLFCMSCFHVKHPTFFPMASPETVHFQCLFPWGIAQ